MALFRALALSFCAMATLFFALGQGGNLAVAKVVEGDAVEKSASWARKLVAFVPTLPSLLQSGRPTPDEIARIQQIEALGDILRLEFFDQAGRYTFGTKTDRVRPQIDPIAQAVLSSKFPRFEVLSGNSWGMQGAFLTRAYFPVALPNGQPGGVIALYLDHTETKKRFETSFRAYGTLLMVFVGLVFAIPGTAFVVQRRITQRAQERFQYLARYDSLTGLLNRRKFIQEATAMHQSKELSAICHIDIDGFKAINDAYGHARGDALLVEMAQVLRKFCRNEDLIARFGGDEFVIALGNCTLESAAMRMRTALEKCAKDWDIDGLKIAASVTIGMSGLKRGLSLNDAMIEADTALHLLKSNGKNSFGIYGKEMGDALRKRNELEAYLRHATREKLFQIHYQPLVRGSDRAIVGHESLLRLYGADGAPIPPSTFIPMLEEMGLIDEVGRWTIKTATREMARRHPDKMIAINLSSAQFLAGDLIDTVKEALAESGLPAKCLELEITESLLLDDSIFVEMQIDTLKEMGVSIVMDDFGTGFSSLSYLWKYGFDRLKIDRSFVAALEENPERSREIIETVVLLGARLDMKITAEGVETEEQSEFLAKLGCDVLQGYLFGKAEPLDPDQTDDTDEARKAS